MFIRKRSFICDTKRCDGKRFKWQAEEGSESDLPDDIMVIILARLPGSSLSRFRFVSKKWLALITKHRHKVAGLHINNGYKTESPSILLHTHTTIRNDVSKPFVLRPWIMSKITLIDPNGRNKRVCDLDKKYTRISPSYNGLVCIYSSVCVSLFNPTTKQELPLPKPTNGYNKWHKRNRCLLGYSPTTKEYKVLHFFWEVTGQDHTQHCEVLMVGKKTSCGEEGLWRRIDSIPWTVSYTGSVVLNGLMYFPVENLVGPERIVIFNLTDESFSTLACPWLQGSEPCSVFESEGFLCASQYSSENGRLEVQKWDPFTGWVLYYTRLQVPPFDGSPFLVNGKTLMASKKVLNMFDHRTEIYQKRIYTDTQAFLPQLHFESILDLSDNGARKMSYIGNSIGEAANIYLLFLFVKTIVFQHFWCNQRHEPQVPRACLEVGRNSCNPQEGLSPGWQSKVFRYIEIETDSCQNCYTQEAPSPKVDK